MFTKARQALDRLKEGNDHFVAEGRQTRILTSAHVREDLTTGQNPFAVILGCSDSRVPTEIIFDQGLGDLFVIRVAGNVVASSQIGSVEFAVQEFGTPLVVVLGHTQCGAVHATLQELGREESQRSPNLASIVDRITPAVQPLLAEGLDEPTLVARSTRANIRQSVERLKTGSQILERHLKEDGVMIIGAEYDLHTGVVDFFGE